MEPVNIPSPYVRQRVGRPRTYFTVEDVREMRRAHSETKYRTHPDKTIEQHRKYKCNNLERIKEKAKYAYQQRKEFKQEGT